jgi:hypothetical protein
MNEFQDRYKKALSQHNAAKRRRVTRRRSKWSGKYLGVVVRPDRDSREKGNDDGG